ncbi:MAG TPA: hypothetical protein VKF59_02460 [Candidatus Dormibacteraeota bacterium]|nr:hypothetical protein [Candidatus Dormibacteraeota bacterium]
MSLKLLWLLFWLVGLLTAAAWPIEASADDFGRPQLGKHVYDSAGVLGAGELASLESQAAGLDPFGARPVVYLRLRSADDAATRADARSLIEAWSVESAPGAADGFVIFFNLRPDDVRHGSAALVAGARLADDGRLSGARLQAIYDQQMSVSLRRGNLAGAIASALTAARADLRTAPGGRSALEWFVSVPVNVVAGLLAILGGAWLLGIWREGRGALVLPVLRVPDTRTPAAIAGALAAGRLRPELAAATVLDLARQGALRIELGAPDAGVVQVVLLDRSRAPAGFQRSVYAMLAARTRGGEALRTPDLPSLDDLWARMRQPLSDELTRAGLYASPTRGRRAGWIAGLALAAATTALLPTVAALEPWGLVGVALLVSVAVLALAVRRTAADTSASGEQRAGPWRSLRAGLLEALPGQLPRDELGELAPYAVATGAAGVLSEEVLLAGRVGYRPEWCIGGVSNEDFLSGWRHLLAALFRRRIPSRSQRGWGGSGGVRPDWTGDNGGGGVGGGDASGGGSF